MMRARITKCLDWNKPEDTQLGWSVLIQKEKGARYNIGVNDGGKPYFKLHKEEAVEVVKKLNKRFRES